MQRMAVMANAQVRYEKRAKKSTRNKIKNLFISFKDIKTNK